MTIFPEWDYPSQGSGSTQDLLEQWMHLADSEYTEFKILKQNLEQKHKMVKEQGI